MVNFLVLFLFICGIIVFVGSRRDKMANPVFRKAFVFELPLYLLARSRSCNGKSAFWSLYSLGSRSF
jgi:hypothetical protein